MRDEMHPTPPSPAVPGRRREVRAGAAWVRVAALAGAAHLGPTVAVTAIVTTLAFASMDWGRALLASGAVLCGQLSVGWSNDAVDHERDRAAGRLDKPIAAGRISLVAVWCAAAAALTVCVVLSVRLGPLPGVVHLTAVAMAWWYNLRLKNSLLSPMPYGVAFAALPAYLTLAAAGSWPPAWTMVVAALLGTGAHFFNVLPDLALDRHNGLRGLPQRCRPAQIAVLGAAQLGTAVALVAVFGPWRSGWAGVGGIALLVAAAACTIATVTAAAGGAMRRAWSLSMATAILVSASLAVNGSSFVS